MLPPRAARAARAARDGFMFQNFSVASPPCRKYRSGSDDGPMLPLVSVMVRWFRWFTKKKRMVGPEASTGSGLGIKE